jgi:hypothetical protein
VTCERIHGFVNAFEDTADFVARGIARAAQDYLDTLARRSSRP